MMNRKIPNINSTLKRSISLPQLSSFLSDLKNAINLRLNGRRKSQSLSLVYDISNSAAPIRKQPHPFAMQALAYRSGRTPALPEWPPPDPPPMTLLNPILNRGLADYNSASETSAPRTWWRRNPPTRTSLPIIHMTVDPVDVTGLTLPIRLIERPAQIGWTHTSEEVEIDRPTDTNIPIPQQASWTEVRSHTILDSFNSPTTTATTTSNLNRNDSSSRAPSLNNRTSMDNTLQQLVDSHEPEHNYSHLNSHPHHYQRHPTRHHRDHQHHHHQSNQQQQPTRSHHTIEPLLLFSQTSDDRNSPISLNAEEVEESSSFHIFLLIVDTNRSVHESYELGQTVVEEITDSHRTSDSEFF